LHTFGVCILSSEYVFRMKYAFISTLGSFVLALARYAQAEDVSTHNSIQIPNERSGIQLHGSGSTAPSKCLWSVMSQFQDRSRVPIRMTYRAVGSSTGQYEFIGDANPNPDVPYQPYNDFGVGDVPISNEDYTTLNNHGIRFVQLPFVLSAVGVFHSVPGVGGDVNGNDGDIDSEISGLNLNLTPCILARIFKRNITHWNHADILALNTGLSTTEATTTTTTTTTTTSPDGTIVPGLPITVARRLMGSASTKALTSYLHQSCPSEWSALMVGSRIDWPEGTSSCEGWTSMAKCIHETPGTIGYIDAGHGHQENLEEVALLNSSGLYLTSKTAAANGGWGAALLNTLPTSAEADFSGVSLLNQPGEYTWPMVTLSYLYVRQTLSHIPSKGGTRSLLKLFLSVLLDGATIGEHCRRFGLESLPAGAAQLSREGINAITVGDADAPQWSLESNTMRGAGMGEFVISTKRLTSYDAYTQGATMDEVQSVQADARASSSLTNAHVDSLQERLQALETLVGKLEATIVGLKEQKQTNPGDDSVNPDTQEVPNVPAESTETVGNQTVLVGNQTENMADQLAPQEPRDTDSDVTISLSLAPRIVPSWNVAVAFFVGAVLRL